MQQEDLTERFTSTLNSHFDADSHTWKCPGKSFHMAKKDIWGHLGGKRIQLCFMIFNLFFLMNVVSSWIVKSYFAHVKPHASNLLLVGLLWGGCLFFHLSKVCFSLTTLFDVDGI